MLTRECCQRRKEDLLFKEVLNRSYYNFEQEGLYTCIASYIFYELKKSKSSVHVYYYRFFKKVIQNVCNEIFTFYLYVSIKFLVYICPLLDLDNASEFFDPIFSSNMFHVTYI